MKFGLIVFFSMLAFVFVAKLIGIPAPTSQPEPLPTIPVQEIYSFSGSNSTNEISNKSEENNLNRLQRIAQGIGITIPVVSGTCARATGFASGVVAACFLMPEAIINVTLDGEALTDSELHCILIHENRHYYQYTNGLVQINEVGEVMNREWLEADAESFAGC